MLFATINMMAKEHFSFKVISIWTHSPISKKVSRKNSPSCFLTICTQMHPSFLRTGTAALP